METVALFLSYYGGPIWQYDKKTREYWSSIPEEYLSNAELVSANDYIREKYRGLFVYEEDEQIYVGFATEEESRKYLEELRRFSDLVKKVLGEEYRVIDKLDYEKFANPRLWKKKEERREARRLRKLFLSEEKKAEKGDIQAMRNVSALLYQGIGTKIDNKKSMYWLKKLVKKNDRAGIYELGRRYFWGLAVRKNRPLGLSYLAKSANLGFEDAFNVLGNILYYGDGGIKKDKKEAMKWFEKGMEKGFRYCTFALARGYEEEALGKPDYLKALEYYFKAGTMGVPESLFGIGRLYEKGWGVEKDYARSFFYYRLSETRGGEGGTYGVGRAYMEGLGVAPDPKKAIEKLEKSGDMGYYRALYFLGIYYKIGKGVEQNDQKAFEYFQKAHDNGSWGGDLELGLCYEEGRGCTKNLFKAFSLVKASADMDFAPACLEMGRYSHEGIGTMKDDEKALKYLLKAVSKKVHGSYEYLSSFYKEKGEEEKARLVMEQKEKDEAMPDYEGEHYRHKDPVALFEFYSSNLSDAAPYPFWNMKEFNDNLRELLFAIVSINGSEEAEKVVMNNRHEKNSEPPSDEEQDIEREKRKFFVDILDGEEFKSSIFGPDEVKGEDPYGNAALAFVELLFTDVQVAFLADQAKMDFIDYLDLLADGLRYMAEDFREISSANIEKQA